MTLLDNTPGPRAAAGQRDWVTSRAQAQQNDGAVVEQARHHLGLLEYEFFRAAWRSWHGGEPDDRHLEPAFMTFLFQGRAPTYVRAFARRVLSDAAAGRLDPVALGGRNGPAPDLALELRCPVCVTALGISLTALILFIL